MPSFNAGFFLECHQPRTAVREKLRKRPLEELLPLEIKTSAQSPDCIRDIQERTHGGFDPFLTLSTISSHWSWEVQICSTLLQLLLE